MSMISKAAKILTLLKVKAVKLLHISSYNLTKSTVQFLCPATGQNVCAHGTDFIPMISKAANILTLPKVYIKAVKQEQSNLQSSFFGLQLDKNVLSYHGPNVMSQN